MYGAASLKLFAWKLADTKRAAYSTATMWWANLTW
jgi:hypothetical protein